MTIPITVDWDSVEQTSRTTLTTHLWTAPPLRRGSAVHDAAFQALRDLNANLARFLPWFSHPRISVPALAPPEATTTSWNFELLDPFVADFVAAAQGRPVVMNFATIPAWMFVPELPDIPQDPDEIVWHYESGTRLRDTSCAEVADYFYRIASWYIAGGFTDELGYWHESGHRYRFAYWEVLCEPDMRSMSPQTYTKLFDAVVSRLRPLDPEMKFIGLSLTHLHANPEYFWHFLDPANHGDGCAPDAMSYHFYAQPWTVNPHAPEGNPPFEQWRDMFFAQADGFIDQTRYIQSIRRRLAPATEIFVNEVGTFTADLLNPEPDIPSEYWALSAAVQSYVWARLVELQIDLVGVAEFIGYPGMIPGVTLLDWDTGRPNARYRALALLMSHFSPGDAVVSTSAGAPEMPDPRVHAQGFVGAGHKRKVLLINKTPATLEVLLPGHHDVHRLDPFAVEVHTP